jgi:signal transduction histidine kinase/DNA-binding response OmpR family regulator/HAMP domain-containing protein
MIKSRLYWRVLANFALLLIILTAMTMLTLNILSQIEKNFILAKADSKSLNEIEMARQYLNDISSAANEYAITSSPKSKSTYISSWKELEFALGPLSDDFSDSSSVRDVRQIRSLFEGWMQFVGDKLIAVGDIPRTSENAKAIQDSVEAAIQTEVQIRYLATARRLMHELYSQKISSLPQNISTATIQSSDLRKFITLVNVLLAVFALALGFVLTRSITIPVRLLKQGTQNIMAGIFEPIVLRRSDELGELAANFNAMSKELGDNYNRLKAYSELVTTLNSLKSLDEIKKQSLQILCENTHASVGALYLVDKEKNVLELVEGYALRQNGQKIKSFAIGEGIPGQCAAEEKVLELDSIPSDAGFSIDTGLVEIIPSYVMAVPILFQNRILGVLVLGSVRKFGDLEKEIINNSVPQLSVGITNAINDDATRKLSLEIARRNEELNSKNEELEKAYRVKSDFLSSMSHELRTPLNSIIGFSSVLLGPTGDPVTPDQRMALGKVLKNGQHLLQLINDILDLSKLESGRMSLSIESDDAASVISSCVMIVEQLIKQKGLQLTQDIQPNLPTLVTDIVKIRQIIVNLLSNAAKFTEKGEIAIRVRENNGLISFSVKDSGIGIEKKNFNLVFEEFQQVDNSSTRKYKGTGLGLPIARKLARLLGGDLMVDSEYGKGSTFTLTIPPSQPQQSQAAPQKIVPKKPEPAPQVTVDRPAQKGPTAPSTGVQILSIDDDPDVIEILRKYLVPEGYSVVGALSGDEGIEMAAKIKPALITLDIMMPKKDGWQVLRELKSNSATKDIPVVIHSVVDNKPLAVSLGATDVITKPTEPKRLLTLVRQYCRSADQFILIVDDHEDFALAFKALLSQDGFNVKVATGGREALDVLKSSTPALILLDLVMPGMDGFEVVQQLQENEQWRKIPVVILSGKELTEEDQRRLDTHITQFLKKDAFSTTEISKTIKRILHSA